MTNHSFDLKNGLDFLNAMRTRLVIKGWRKGYSSFREGTAKGILEVIDIVAEDLGMSYQETTRIEDFLREIVESQTDKFSQIAGDSYTTSLLEWNDYRHRKLSHVLELLDTGISMIMSEQEHGLSKLT